VQRNGDDFAPQIGAARGLRIDEELGNQAVLTRSRLIDPHTAIYEVTEDEIGIKIFFNQGAEGEK
jgi:hypothetical protein